MKSWKISFNAFAALAALAMLGACASHNSGTVVGFVDGGEGDRTPAAASLNLNPNATSSGILDQCNTTAKVFRDSGTLFLQVDNIPGKSSSCSNVLIKQDGDFDKVGKIKGGTTSEKIALSEKYGNNTFVVRLESNSGKTSGDITVTSYVAKPQPKRTKVSPYAPSDFTLSTYLFGRKGADLADCGGSVWVSINGGTVYLNFRNVEKCSNFDILMDNGSATQYTKQKIGSEGNRSESIAIPREFYQTFGNSIKVVAKSNSEATYDVFRVEFFAW